MSKCEHEVETRCVRPLRVSPKRAFFIRKMGENMSLKYITEIKQLGNVEKQYE